MLKWTLAVLVACFLTVATWSGVSAQADKSPLVSQGTFEISTIGSVMGGNLLGLGAGYMKAGDSSITTLGFSLGYFATNVIELEGTFGLMRTASEWFGETVSSTLTMTTGKFVFNFAGSGTSVIPYAFGGAGLIDAEDDSESIYTFGGGVKVPIKSIKRIGLRFEYSYTNSFEEDAEGIHTISIAFSAFFKPGSGE